MTTMRLGVLCVLLLKATCFTLLPQRTNIQRSSGIVAWSAPPKGFGTVREKKAETNKMEDVIDVSTKSPLEIKALLLDLLPRMMGTPQELQAVETYINALEDKYMPAQTLDFLNLAMGGEWQLLFSTNRLGVPKSQFRLREMFQRVETNGLEGNVTNQVQWDFAQGAEGEENPTAFDVMGTFAVKCKYEINQGARMIVNVTDHVVELLPGSQVPRDVPGLVGLIHRAMPKELFDPNDHAMDTTYLDGDLRIVRMTGPQHEGIRDIFIRRGSLEIDPTAK